MDRVHSPVKSVLFRSCFCRWIGGLLVAAVFTVGTFQAQAADLIVEARLIWGTNDEKSPNPKHKPVDDELAGKLRKIFKWKNYFQETRKKVTVPNRESKRFSISPECEIEIKELEGPKIELQLIGKGKVVNRTTKGFTKGELITLGGDSGNGSAWFVTITLLEERAPSK